MCGFTSLYKATFYTLLLGAVALLACSQDITLLCYYLVKKYR